MKLRFVSAFLLGLLMLPVAALLAVLTLAGDLVAQIVGQIAARVGVRSTATGAARDITRASIIVLNWNGRDLLAQGLPALLAAVQQAGGRHEVIVVDNGSSDGSADYVRTAFPMVKIVALERNLGFGDGNDAGVRAASHDIVVLLNNDMAVDAGFLAPLLRPFADERVFAVSSQIFMGDPARQRVETGLTGGEIKDGRLRVWHSEIGATESEPRPCLWAGGGSGAFDRRRFLALGGFNRLYAPFYVEDVDLSYRAWRRGWTVLLAPQSKVYHRHRTSTSRLGSDYVEQALAKNQRLFVWHNVTDVAWTLASLARLPGDVAAAVRADERNEQRALLWALRQWPAAIGQRWAESMRRAGGRGVEGVGVGYDGRPTDRQVLRIACHRYYYKEWFVPRRPLARGHKKILVVCPYLPVPPAHGGAVRMLNLIKNLSVRNDVDVLSFIDSDDERASAPQLEPYCRRLRLVLRRLPSGRYDAWRDRSWHIEEFDTPEMQQAVLDMMGEEDYDVLQIEYTQMASYHPGTRRCQTALDEVDVTFRSFYRRKIAGRRLAARHDIVDYLKLVRFEVESCRRFDHVLAMSATDAACLADYLPQKRQAIVEIANGVDTSYYTPPAAWPGGRDLLFVGSYRHTPNQDGMRFFLRDVFPLIQRQAADARLYIVGDGPWVDMPEAHNPAVTCTGFVEDTRPYLAHCATAVAPILAGSGTRIKILEALAAGIPVVSTSVGCEGIEARPGEDVLIADSAQDFATAVTRLLADPALAEKLRCNGRRLVEDKYDWRAIAARLDALYASAGSDARPQ